MSTLSDVLHVAIIVSAVAVIFAMMAALKSVMQMQEPGRLTVFGFLALMVVLTLVWIGLIAWAALVFLR